MTPDWKDAPEWAEYLAMDSNGAWWWFENEPELQVGTWRTNGGQLRRAGHPQVDFRESKEERPE